MGRRFYSNKDRTKAFLEKINIQDASNCWNWTGAVNNKGYPQVRLFGVTHLATRVMWTIYYGSDPGNFQVCHKCDNPLCVNPDHLFLGTNSDNISDRMLKNRSRTGKFNKDKVKEIQDLQANKNYSFRQLAKMYNTSYKTIYNIIHRNCGY